MHQKGFSLVILILVIFLLGAASAGGYYLGTRAKSSPEQPQAVSNTTPSSTTAHVADLPISLLGEYKKRFYDPAKVFTGKAPYPLELTSVSESDLSSLRCSPSFQRDDLNSRYIYYKDNSSDPLVMNDPKLIELAEKSFEVDFGGEFYLACQVDDGRYILVYNKPSGGGGLENKIAFGVLSKDNVYEKITEIANDNIPYFGCSSPYQLTKTNILWYRCGGGDGAYSANSIYKIDINAKTNNRLIKCETSDDLDKQGISEKCQ